MIATVFIGSEFRAVAVVAGTIGIATVVPVGIIGVPCPTVPVGRPEPPVIVVDPVHPVTIGHPT